MNNMLRENTVETIPHDQRIRSVLGRLELIIDNENDRIGTDPQFDLKVSNAHKSRCLYELTMLFRDTPIGEMAQNHLGHMHALKDKLALNASRVEAHLDAVRSVADILKNAMRDEDADGTYSQEQFLYGVS